jgi:phospholipid-binding lipoprotein MlaA
VRPTRLLAGALATLLFASLPAGAQEADDPGGEPQAAPDPYAEYDDLAFEDDADADLADDSGDPFETVNRGIFWVNDGIDRYALEPVSTAFDYALPDPVQRALRNAFDNLRFPIVFFNDLFQGKPVAAGRDLARFLLNTTVGIGGFLDPASTIGLEKHNEDFGQTLGYWGVPPGPYLMLPFFGPSNIRDGCGLIVDSAFRAFGFFIPFWVSLSMQAVDTVNRRALIRDEIRAERRAALDWYAAVRSAYSQYRENLVKDRRAGVDTDYTLFPSFEPEQGEPDAPQDPQNPQKP